MPKNVSAFRFATSNFYGEEEFGLVRLRVSGGGQLATNLLILYWVVLALALNVEGLAFLTLGSRDFVSWFGLIPIATFEELPDRLQLQVRRQ